MMIKEQCQVSQPSNLFSWALNAIAITLHHDPGVLTPNFSVCPLQSSISIVFCERQKYLSQAADGTICCLHRSCSSVSVRYTMAAPGICYCCVLLRKGQSTLRITRLMLSTTATKRQPTAYGTVQAYRRNGPGILSTLRQALCPLMPLPTVMMAGVTYSSDLEPMLLTTPRQLQHEEWTWQATCRRFFSGSLQVMIGSGSFESRKP